MQPTMEQIQTRHFEQVDFKNCENGALKSQKSRIQHCEQSEQRLQKFTENAKNVQFGKFLNT